MAITLTGKIVICCLVLAVASGMGGTIYLIISDESSAPSSTPPPPQPTPAPNPSPAPVDPDILYEVGVGIADMTGPCVEITFMGYAELGMKGAGIHLRQFARAFIIRRGEARVVMVTAEVQAVGIYVRREVVKKLQALYGDTYRLDNVLISGTHTHSAPGGHLVEFLLDVSILGFSRETFDAYVDGITRSIVRAHEAMVPARLYYSESRVLDAHVNRSPQSYEYNPPEERARYARNTDTTLSQLRLLGADGSVLGAMSWFAVHAVSMNMSNHLVSSDNLGVAALLMERDLNPPGTLVGKGSVVCGFFAGNIGDVSPNLLPARCELSGGRCDNQQLLCPLSERCYSQGPGRDMEDSARIIGDRIYRGAMEAYLSPGEELRGPVGAAHQFVDMPQQRVPRYDPVAMEFNTDEMVSGCVPAMGYSFAAGTTDGANTLNITQGTIEGIPLLDAVSGLIATPTPEDVACHRPKPILLATGRANFPLPWQPSTVSVSVGMLGGVAVGGVPGEPTTMTGRRIRTVIGKEMEKRGLVPRVVVGGLTNEYISYVATYEEYQLQRYEGASTIYGPHTLDILLNKFAELTAALLDGSPLPPGPSPADHRNRTLSLIAPVVLDSAGDGSFGDVLQQPPPTVYSGDEVEARFVAANPRNDLQQESSHAEVQRLELGRWVTVATDADLHTRFSWERTSLLLGTSTASFSWRPPAGTLGTHRLLYRGVARSLLGQHSPFTGETDPFYVQPINVR